MVTYIPSFATKTITAIDVEVLTTLSLFAPDEVVKDVIFEIYGQLTRDDTGEAIQQASIDLSYNGTGLGSAVTDIQGVYRILAVLPDPGIYTLRADFAGGVGFAASSAQASLGVIVAALEPIYRALASAAVGTALVMLSYSK